MRKTLVTILMVFSFDARAVSSPHVQSFSRWSYVVSNGNGEDYYIDYSSIKKTSQGYRAWDLANHAAPNKYGIFSSAVLTEYDCDEGRSRSLQGHSYTSLFGLGDIKYSVNRPGEWKYLIPYSAGETMLKAVCDRKR